LQPDRLAGPDPELEKLREIHRHQERVYLYGGFLFSLVLAVVAYLSLERVFDLDKGLNLICAILAGLGLGGIGNSIVTRRKG